MPKRKKPTGDQAELSFDAPLPPTEAPLALSSADTTLELERPNGEKVQHDNAPLATSYRNWFLEYASYVILDRAVPHIDDGLKPVQRRVLHTLWDMDDGRFHKVANVVGATMKLHPHGDASIGAALVSIGQRLAHRAPGQLRQPAHRRRCRGAPLHRSAPDELRQGRALQPEDHHLAAQLRRPQQGAHHP